jgi:hypothetical protein
MTSSARRCRIKAIGLILLLITTVLSHPAIAQEPTVAWTRQFGSVDRDGVWGVASDSSGVYATGYTFAALTGQTHAGGWDAYVKKHDLAGNELWTRQFGTALFDAGAGIASHGTSIYIVGAMDGGLTGEPSQTATVLVRKYDSDGNELWTRLFGPGTTHHTRGFAISVDATGIYVGGLTLGNFDGSNPNLGVADAFVRKYDQNGNEIWTRQFGTSNEDEVWTVATHVTGVYVGGYTVGSLAGANLGLQDAFVRKYDHDGNEIWTRQFGTTGTEHVQGIVASSDGVYVVGETNGALPGQINAGGFDLFVRKYDFNGNELWTRQFGTASDDTMGAFGADAGGDHVAADGSGVYVTGATGGTLGSSNLGNLDAILRKYSHEGAELWTLQFGTSGTDGASALSANPEAIYVGGYTFGAFPGEVSTGNADSFVARISDNQPPVAEAGDTQAVSVGDTVHLDGSGSHDAETASEDLLYTWQFTSLPVGSTAALIGANTVNPTFVADLLGDYVVSLVVTDEGGLSSAPDEVTISSLNAPPNANAGPDQGAYVGALVTLDGGGSFDPDGDPLSYAWTLISAPTGSTATLTNPATVSPFFSPDVPGVYDIELIVNDGHVDSNPDTMTVLVASVEDYVCGRVVDALNLVASLPASSFTNKGNRTAFNNLLMLACKSVQKGNTNQALHKLEQAFERTDGCALRGTPDVESSGPGAPPAKDYIITCIDQAAIYPLIQEALGALTP